MKGAALALSLLLGAPAAAEGCRLALVLGLDVSSSVDGEEDRLQREGLARALLAPEVARAFAAGDPVALYVFEWSGRSVQVPVTGWELVQDEGDIARVAGLIAASERSRDDSSTAVGAALGHAAQALEGGPDCRARTIDLSGDGIGNDGIRPATAYARFPLSDVTVNALVIGGERAGSALVAWFAEEVIQGPGAFWMHVSDYAGYEAAMRIKLLRELELPAVSKAPRPAL